VLATDGKWRNAAAAHAQRYNTPVRISAVIFVTLLYPALACAQQPSGKTMAELFAQDDPPAAQAQLQSVVDAAGNDTAKLKEAIAADAAYEAMPPGWMRRTVQVLDGKDKYDVEYFVRVPEGYDGKKALPLLVLCHGQHNNGMHIGKAMELRLGRGANDYVILSPSMPGEEVYNARQYQEQSYLRPMGWVRTHLNIDDDRMFISGYSQGGHHTWHMAAMHERLWAAAVPMAGVPWFEGEPWTQLCYLGNLRNVPVWALWGEKDRADPKAQGNVDLCRQTAERLKKLGDENFTGTELANTGHGGCWAPTGQLLKFLADKKRGSLPRNFEHSFHAANNARAYYLEATAFQWKPLDLSKRLEVAMPGGVATSQSARDAIQEHVSRKLFKMTCKLETEKNTITIQGLGIRTVRLYVMEGMFDLSKPVTIRYLGRIWTGRITPSARCMIEHYAATRDQTQLYLNELDLDLSRQVQQRYK
jgi:pimeloyl-ACP methyl ester carboxylesterase